MEWKRLNAINLITHSREIEVRNNLNGCACIFNMYNLIWSFFEESKLAKCGLNTWPFSLTEFYQELLSDERSSQWFHETFWTFCKKKTLIQFDSHFRSAFQFQTFFLLLLLLFKLDAYIFLRFAVMRLENKRFYFIQAGVLFMSSFDLCSIC